MPLANRARAVWGRVRNCWAKTWSSCRSATCASATPRSRPPTWSSYAGEVRALGLELGTLHRRELSERYGFFSDQVVAGSLSPQDGHANPRLAGPAFARARARAGAQVLEHKEVLHVEKDGGDFVAHTADGERYRGAQLIDRRRRMVESAGGALRRSACR